MGYLSGGHPGVEGYTARQSIHAIVTLGIATALFAFAFLEIRAHRNA